MMLELVDSIVQLLSSLAHFFCTCTYQSSNMVSGLHPIMCWRGCDDGVIISQGTDSPAEEHSASQLGFVYF